MQFTHDDKEVTFGCFGAAPTVALLLAQWSEVTTIPVTTTVLTTIAHDEKLAQARNTIEELSSALPSSWGARQEDVVKLRETLLQNCKDLQAARATSVLRDLQSTAAKLEPTLDKNINLYQLQQIIVEEEMTNTSLSKHLVVAQSIEARDFYQAYKYLESAHDWVNNVLARNMDLPTGLVDKFENFTKDKLSGRAVVGVMTAIQALQRPLVVGETRQQVASKCKQLLVNRSMLGDLPANLRAVLLARALPAMPAVPSASALVVSTASTSGK